MSTYPRTLVADAMTAKQSHTVTESSLHIHASAMAAQVVSTTHMDLSSANVDTSNLSEYVRNFAKRYDSDVA
jgi:hypothetical protein